MTIRSRTLVPRLLVILAVTTLLPGLAAANQKGAQQKNSGWRKINLKSFGITHVSDFTRAKGTKMVRFGEKTTRNTITSVNGRAELVFPSDFRRDEIKIVRYQVKGNAPGAKIQKTPSGMVVTGSGLEKASFTLIATPSANPTRTKRAVVRVKFDNALPSRGPFRSPPGP